MPAYGKVMHDIPRPGLGARHAGAGGGDAGGGDARHAGVLEEAHDMLAYEEVARDMLAS
jgi:hypothetical protein